MIKNSILFILVLLMTGCGRLEFNEEAIEKTIFGKPLPNRVGLHDHEADSHDLKVDDETVAAKMQVVLVPSELVVDHNRMAVGLLGDKKQMIQDAECVFTEEEIAMCLSSSG